MYVHILCVEHLDILMFEDWSNKNGPHVEKELTAEAKIWQLRCIIEIWTANVVATEAKLISYPNLGAAVKYIRS